MGIHESLTYLEKKYRGIQDKFVQNLVNKYEYYLGEFFLDNTIKKYNTDVPDVIAIPIDPRAYPPGLSRANAYVTKYLGLLIYTRKEPYFIPKVVEQPLLHQFSLNIQLRDPYEGFDIIYGIIKDKFICTRASVKIGRIINVYDVFYNYENNVYAVNVQNNLPVTLQKIDVKEAKTVSLSPEICERYRRELKIEIAGDKITVIDFVRSLYLYKLYNVLEFIERMLGGEMPPRKET